MKKEVVVISLGGSVIVHDKIDSRFLKKFCRTIRGCLGKYKFVIVVGGGKTCRAYQLAARSIAKDRLGNDELDWIGIYSTWLNASLIRALLNDVAYKEVVKDPRQKIKFDKVLIAGGWKPGFSTDYDSVMFAKTFNAKTVVNMTSVDYLHDRNPEVYKNTKIIKETDWNGFMRIIGNKWSPGMNAPFDPVASRLAQRLGIRLVLIGKELKNLRNGLAGRKFKGSVVKS